MYDINEGGGYLNGLLSHDIDLISSLFGRPVAVCAEVRSSIPVRQLSDGGVLNVTADDSSALLMRLESGALAVLSASVMGAHMTPRAHLDVFGEKGTISGALGSRQGDTLLAGAVTDEGLFEVTLDDRIPAHDEVIPARGAAAPIRAMALMLEDWLPQIHGGLSAIPVPTFEDGWVVQKVIEAARESSRGAGWVSIA